MRDYTTIKQSKWIIENFPEAKKYATLFYSNQYKDHEYLGLPDYAYLRLAREEGKIELNRLPSWTGAQLFKALPESIEGYPLSLDYAEKNIILQYTKEDKNSLGLPYCNGECALISIGKNLVDICFDMMTRIKEGHTG